MTTEVKVPTLGESITEATLGQWLKRPGEPVAADEPIASLETDKVAVEVNAPVAGVMGEQAVGEGDTVRVGAVIAFVQENGQPVSGAALKVEDRTAVGQAEAAAPDRRKDHVADCREGENEGRGDHQGHAGEMAKDAGRAGRRRRADRQPGNGQG